MQTQFRYDNLNRAYQVDYSDGTPSVTNKYDQVRTGYFNNGHLTEALTAAVGSIPATGQLYNFDLMGRVANHEQTVGTQSYALDYTYNFGGTLTSEKYPSGRIVNYAFDDGARLSQVSSGATTYASQFDYTSATGMLKSVTMGNGAVESYVYNSRLQLQSLDLTKSGTQLQHFDYKYGLYNPATNTVDESKNNGQIAQIEGFIGAQKQWQQRFTSDSIGRLTSAREFRGDNSQQSYLVCYEYDLFGNRYQKQAQNNGNPFTQKWVEAADIDQSTNRFNSGVTYDNAGNITVDSRFRNLQFQYDANNRQKQSANLDGTGAVVSVYDAGGQRVGTQVGGSLISVMVYDAMAKLVAEYNSATTNGGTQYFFTDHQGSPRAITNSAGTVISRHDYLAFGEELSTVGMRTSGQGYGGADAARQKYAGMENDDATGMSHTLWRQYDSYSGRWTAPDPYGGSMTVGDPQSFNRYSYVLNNPTNSTDPLGLIGGDTSSRFNGAEPSTDEPPGDPFERGRDITRAAMERFDRRVADTIFANYLNSQINSGRMTREEAQEAIKGDDNLEIEEVTEPVEPQNTSQTSADRIASIAAKNVGDESWRTSTARTAKRNPKLRYKAGENKCNLFVYEVLLAAGVKPPTSGGKGKWPARAGEWANPNVKNLGGWVIVQDGSVRPGDVISQQIPYSDASGHVAIIGPDKATYGTGVDDGIISRTDWGFRSGQGGTIERAEGYGPVVIRRYQGP